MKKISKKKGWLMPFLLLSIASALLAGLFLWDKKPKINIPDTAPSEESKQQKYEYLISHISPVPIKTGFCPVFICRDPTFTDRGTAEIFWSSSGTALLENGIPKWVVTAAHCFGRDATYYIYLVTPNTGQHIWGIESVKMESSQYNKEDLALAKVSAPKNATGGGDAPEIKSIWSDSNSPKYNQKVQIASVQRKYYVRSLITGERYPVIGTAKFADDAVKYCIMDYSTTKAESGSGFISDDGQLLVLNQYVVLDEKTQRDLGIEPRSGYFTLLTQVNIKWP